MGNTFLRSIQRFLPVWRSSSMRTRSNPTAPALSDAGAARWGVGTDWAPTTYAQYFATSAVVFACVSYRARNLARVRLEIHQQEENGETRPVGTSHQLQQLLDHPNPHWSAYRFWYMVEASLCLYGSCPIAIFRDGDGRPVELWTLHPSYFSVVPDPRDYMSGYLYQRDAIRITLRPEDVIWLRYPNPVDEYSPLSPMAALRMTVDTDLDATRFNRRFFQNDATPGRVYVKVPTEITTSQASAVRAQWEDTFKGEGKQHKTAVLGLDADVKALGIPQRDMEFLGGQQFNREAICAGFGISPILLGDLRFSSLNNSQIAKAGFWAETMVPEMALIESELNASLMNEGSRVEGQGSRGEGRGSRLEGEGSTARLVARFSTTQVGELREDGLAKATRQSTLVAAGLRTINELRNEDGMAPVAWGDKPPATPTAPAARGAPPTQVADAQQPVQEPT